MFSDPRRTPLDIAAFRGHAPCVERLADFGTDCNTCDAVTHRTPLMAAAMNGHSGCVDLLLSDTLNTDPKAVDSSGRCVAA